MNEASRDRLAPALRRTWLFGAGADRVVHEAMAQSGADVLIQDLEDFTPPVRRHEARALAPALYQRCAKPARWCACASTRWKPKATWTCRT